MLDSCPFCGGTAYLWQNYNQKAGCYFVFVKCDTCNSQGRSFRSETSPEGDDWENEASIAAVNAGNMRTSRRREY